MDDTIYRKDAIDALADYLRRVCLAFSDLRRTFSDKSDGIANVMTNTMNRLEKCLHGCHCQSLTGGIRNDSTRIFRRDDSRRHARLSGGGGVEYGGQG